MELGIAKAHIVLMTDVLEHERYVVEPNFRTQQVIMVIL